MRDVLDNFESHCGGVDITNTQSVLAQAFLYELSSDDSYLKVPSDHVEAIEDFLEKLTGKVEATPTKVTMGPKLLVSPAARPDQEAPHAS